LYLFRKLSLNATFAELYSDFVDYVEPVDLIADFAASVGPADFVAFAVD
jgi:hypothetical protein